MALNPNLSPDKLGRWFPDIVPVRGRVVDVEGKSVLADVKVDDVPSLASVREVVRKLLSSIHQMEGRNGDITFLNNITVEGDTIIEGDIIINGDIEVTLTDITVNGFVFIQNKGDSARLVIEVAELGVPPEVTDPNANALVIYQDPTSQRLKVREYPALTAHWLADQTIQTLAYQAGVWTNMPLALTEMFGDTRLRTAMDLTNFTEFRVVANLTVAGAAGAVIYPRFDAGAGFLEMGAGALGRLTIDSTGVLTGNWATMDTNGKADVELQMVGSGGDGAADPAFGIIQLQFR